MANNNALQFLRISKNSTFNSQYENGLGKDGQPVYVKDTCRLYIGNGNFNNPYSPGDPALIPVVTPYKHTVKLYLQGIYDGRESQATGNENYPIYSLLKYLRVEAIINFTSFKKEAIESISTTGNDENVQNFYTALSNLGNEEKIIDKMFPVSISGIAHTGVITGADLGGWNWDTPQGIMGPIVGFEPGKKILVSYLAEYNNSFDNAEDNIPPSNLVNPKNGAKRTDYTFASAFHNRYDNPTTHNYFFDSCGEQIESNNNFINNLVGNYRDFYRVILPGTIIAANIDFSYGGGSGAHVRGSISDTVTDNY